MRRLINKRNISGNLLLKSRQKKFDLDNFKRQGKKDEVLETTFAVRAFAVTLQNR